MGIRLGRVNDCKMVCEYPSGEIHTMYLSGVVVSSVDVDTEILDIQTFGDTVVRQIPGSEKIHVHLVVERLDFEFGEGVRVPLTPENIRMIRFKKCEKIQS